MTARLHPYLEWPGPIPFAHRGGAGEHPENTMEAFEAVVSMGYYYLETDVRITADGVLVAFHDERLERMSDRTGRIEDHTWADLAGAVIGERASLLRFEELLGAWADRRINVDPKMDAAVGPLCEAIARAGALDRVCVASFSERRIRAARRRLGPSLCTALGPAAIGRLRLGLYRIPGWAPTGQVLQVPIRWGPVTVLDARTIAEASRRGLPVHVWTVDEPAELNRVLDLGVWGVMTDHPTILKQVLVERGQWT